MPSPLSLCALPSNMHNSEESSSPAVHFRSLKLPTDIRVSKFRNTCHSRILDRHLRTRTRCRQSIFFTCPVPNDSCILPLKGKTSTTKQKFLFRELRLWQTSSYRVA